MYAFGATHRFLFLRIDERLAGRGSQATRRGAAMGRRLPGGGVAKVEGNNATTAASSLNKKQQYPAVK
jgi:hypothetical protein